MAPHVLSGVIRICTHPRVFAQPSAIHEVIEFCGEWITLDRDYARFPGLKWRIL